MKMKTRPSHVTAFGFFLNFNRPTSDYGVLVRTLIERGFAKRFPRVGYLVAKGQPFVQNRELLEQTGLIESDPEEVSAVGKYSVVSLVPSDSGKEIVIGHHPDTPKFDSNSREILEEITGILDILRGKTGHAGLVPCRLFTATSIKTEKRPYQALARFEVDKLPLFTKMIPDIELARWENEIYLYSTNIKRTGGPGPIMEDMRLKGLPRGKDDRKQAWDQIILKPRPGEYHVSMEYKTDDMDDLIEKFKGTESMAATMISELENLTDWK